MSDFIAAVAVVYLTSTLFLGTLMFVSWLLGLEGSDE